MASPLMTRRACVAAITLAALSLAAAACESSDGPSGTADDTDAVAGAADPGQDASVEIDSEEPAADGGDVADTDGVDPDLVVAVVPPASWATNADRNPMAIHMTYQTDPSAEVTFTWATALTDLEAYTPRVWLVPASEVTDAAGELPMAGKWVSEGVGVRYQTVLLDTVLDETWYVRWTVVVSGLSPATDYVWRVGSWAGFDATTGELDSPDLSRIGSLRTAPVKGSREAYSVVLAGDSRGGNQPIRDNMSVFENLDVDMWFFNGDFSQGGTQPEWADWYDAMQPILAGDPLMTVRGNHEIFADLYYHQVALPVEPSLPPEMVEHAWTLDYGNAHFVGLDSNGEDAAEAQVDFLHADLAAARADPDIDFIIVMMHHAVYSASNHGNTSWIHTHWVSIFEDYDVDLVFSGHDHNYERSHPIRGGEVAEDGITYVVAGAFFAPAYSNGNEWWTATSTHGDKANFALLTVNGDQLELTAYSGDGTEVLDELTLSKR